MPSSSSGALLGFILVKGNGLSLANVNKLYASCFYVVCLSLFRTGFHQNQICTLCCAVSMCPLVKLLCHTGLGPTIATDAAEAMKMTSTPICHLAVSKTRKCCCALLNWPSLQV